VRYATRYRVLVDTGEGASWVYGYRATLAGACDMADTAARYGLTTATAIVQVRTVEDDGATSWHTVDTTTGTQVP
jgi:hypothetical protein